MTWEQDVRALLDPQHQPYAVAVLTPQSTRSVVVGAVPEADFEIGSVTKGLTGLLYLDACERGEVTPSTRLDEHLELGGTAVGAVPLGPISQHAAGLPRLAPYRDGPRRTWRYIRRGDNVHVGDLADLLGDARRAKVGRTTPRYSNLGYQLLGHAVASAAGATYPELLRERLTDPLRLTDTYAPSQLSDLRPAALRGTLRGKPVQPWLGAALAPAGGVRATIDDLSRLLRALLERTAPGVGALEPTAVFNKQMRVGAAWMTSEQEGRSITWHNGGTGGFRSWLGMDRERGTAAVVLTASTRGADDIGQRLLTAASR